MRLRPGARNSLAGVAHEFTDQADVKAVKPTGTSCGIRSPIHSLLISDVSRLRTPGCVMPIAVRSCSRPTSLPINHRHIHPPSATAAHHHHCWINGRPLANHHTFQHVAWLGICPWLLCSFYTIGLNIGRLIGNKDKPCSYTMVTA